MSDLIIPDVGSRLANLFERVAELERKVLVFGDDPGEEAGCCTVLCCNDAPGDSLGTGESAVYCTVTLEETAGVALRLVVLAQVTIAADAPGMVIADAAATVDSQMYLERPRVAQTMLTSDMIPIPVVNVIDTNSPAPVIGITVRNLNTVAFTVVSVNLAVLVYGVRDGSTACGESAGTS